MLKSAQAPVTDKFSNALDKIRLWKFGLLGTEDYATPLVPLNSPMLTTQLQAVKQESHLKRLSMSPLLCSRPTSTTTQRVCTTYILY